MKRVTDPALLAELEGKPVTDTRLLIELEAPDESDAETERLKRTGQSLSKQYQAFPQEPDLPMKVRGGVSHAWDRAALGVKELLPEGVQKAGDWLDEKLGMTPLTRNQLEQGKAFVEEHGLPAQAGAVGADVAMSAGPIGFVNKGVQVAKAAPVLGKTLQALAGTRYAAPVADVAANAAYSAATAPDNRGEAAMYGGGGAAGGRVLARTLGGLVKPSQQGQALLDQGVRLTPGQAGEGAMGKLARFSEEAAEPIPGIGGAVRGAKDQALGDWNKSLIGATVPRAALAEGASPPTTMEGLKKVYDEAYKKLFPPGKTVQLEGESLANYVHKTEELAERVAPSVRPKFREVADWISGHLELGLKADHYKEMIDKEIASAIKTASREGQNSLVRALKQLDLNAKQALVDLHGNPAVLGVLDKVDQGYGAFKVLQKAGARMGPIKRGGTLLPTDVIAANRGGNPAMTQRAATAHQVFGNAPNALDTALNVAKTGAVAAAGGLGHAAFALPPTAMALLSSFQGGRDFLLGQLPWQEFMQHYPSQAAQLIRALTARRSSAPQEEPQQTEEQGIGQ